MLHRFTTPPAMQLLFASAGGAAEKMPGIAETTLGV
jgi:hypothetical protein